MCSAASASQLRIAAVDERGVPIWTRLEVRGNDRTYQPASDAIVTHTNPRQPADLNYTGSFVVLGNAAVEVPPGNYIVVAEHGLEYERVEKTVQVSATRPAAVEIQLRPWIRMRQRGWYSGDMHVHRDPADMPALTLAEDLNISVDFTIWNKRNLWVDRALRAEPVVRVSPDQFVTLMNTEDERRHGAWMLHNLRRPLEHFAVDGRWYPAGLNFIRAAREQKDSPSDLFPWFDSEKPIWWGLPVMIALAPPDSIGVIHNHFNQYGVVANEAWGRPRDQAKYPGQQGFTEYSLQLYYRYLNLGFRIPPSAGSASGVLPNPVGYNRMYVPVSGPLTVEKWYAAVRAGKVLVTNGPILFANVTPSGTKLTVSVEAHSREPIDRIEIVANGQVIHGFRPDGFVKDFTSQISLDAGRHSWVAARCFLKPEGTIRFAHTSPVYLGKSWDASADARYFVAWIDDLIADTNSGANAYEAEAEKQENLKLYREAREFYAGRVR
jgi:hypothetical protein